MSRLVNKICTSRINQINFYEPNKESKQLLYNININFINIIISLILWFISCPLLIFLPSIIKDTEFLILILILTILITINLVSSFKNYIINNYKLKKLINDGIDCVTVKKLLN